ncbi:MAG: SGNH/GDSL hydrolase family protein [Desulfobaccales bacterium]
MDRTKAILKNILAILFGLVLALMALEMLLRVFQPVEYRVRGNRIILPRNKHYIFTTDKTNIFDRVIYFSKNPLGFRGDLPPRNFAQTLTIITVGGSTTECMNITDGKTWSDLLANRLKREFKPFWLNNAGLTGNSTFGHLVLMEDYLIPLKPKVLVFLIGANDQYLLDYCEWDKKTLRKPWVNLHSAIIDPLAHYSEVAHYIINFGRYFKAKHMGLTHGNVDFAALKTRDIPDEQLQAILARNRANYLEPYARRIQKLIDLCSQHGMEPVFVTQPLIYGDGIDPVSGADLARVAVGDINGKTSWEILELYNQVLRQVAAKNKVLLIDLAGKMPKSSRYFYDHMHFSNTGCEFAAETIHEQLAPFLSQKFPEYVNKD